MAEPRSKILDAEKPLNVETKPIAGLTGTLWNEMVEIENQTKNKGASQRQSRANLKAASAAASSVTDMIWSPVDQYLAEMDQRSPRTPKPESPKSTTRQVGRSGLTGNQQI